MVEESLELMQRPSFLKEVAVLAPVGGLAYWKSGLGNYYEDHGMKVSLSSQYVVGYLPDQMSHNVT